MEFTTTALNVLMMLAYSVPGFIFVKTKMIDQSHIASFAKVLLYVCSPALSIYSFNSVDYSKELLINLGLMLLLSFLLQIAVLGLTWLVLRKKYADPRYRVCCVASVLGNVGFFGGVTTRQSRGDSVFRSIHYRYEYYLMDRRFYVHHR